MDRSTESLHSHYNGSLAEVPNSGVDGFFAMQTSDPYWIRLRSRTRWMWTHGMLRYAEKTLFEKCIFINIKYAKVYVIS